MSGENFTELTGDVLPYRGSQDIFLVDTFHRRTVRSSLHDASFWLSFENSRHLIAYRLSEHLRGVQKSEERTP